MEAPRRRYQSDYIDGNTAKSLNVVPDFSNDEYGERRTRDNRQVRRQPQRIQKVRTMNLASLLVLTLAIGATLFVCINYLIVQTDITIMSKKIASSKSDLLQLKEQNDAMQQRVDSSVDLAYIYKVATKELGMVHPKNNQVIKYDSSNDDYVRQYGDIPSSNESNLIDKFMKGK